MSGQADVEGETFRTNSIISAMSESAAPSTAFSSMAAMTERTLLGTNTNGPGSLSSRAAKRRRLPKPLTIDEGRDQTHTDFPTWCGNSLSRKRDAMIADTAVTCV